MLYEVITTDPRLPSLHHSGYVLAEGRIYSPTPFGCSSYRTPPDHLVPGDVHRVLLSLHESRNNFV